MVTGGPVPHELPRAVVGFVNRSLELRQIEHVSVIAAPEGACVVVVLGGTAGVGKTALALRWAHQAAQRFPDGQLYVNMRGFDDREPLTPFYALGSLLRSLGVASAEIPLELEERAGLYQSLMSGSRRIVCLDNVVSAEQARLLLPATAGCIVLVTTRGTLPGLGPLEGAHRVTLDLLPETEAVTLLQVAGGRRQVADDPTELAQLARLCGLLPLALRIVGDRLAALPFTPVGDLLAALHDESERLDALILPTGDGTVRAVFAWSYRELEESAATVFRRLGAHPGEHFTVESGAAVTGLSVKQARHCFAALTGAHLLEQVDARRYRIHDLLRAYAIDLSRAEDGEAVLREATLNLASWYLESVTAAATAMGLDIFALPDHAAAESMPGGMQFAGFEQAWSWFETERENAAASVLAAAKLSAYETSWRLAAALLGIFEVTNEFDDWFASSRCGLEAARADADQYGQGLMLESLGKAYKQSHQFDLAEHHQHEALRIREQIGDAPGVVRSVNALGLLYRRAGDFPQARAHFLRAAESARTAADRTWLAFALMNLGGLDVETGAFDTARGELLEALTLLDGAGESVYQVNALKDLGAAQRGLGDAHAALETVNRAARLAAQLRNNVFLAEALLEVARTCRTLSDPGQALLHYAEVIAIQRRVGDRGREAIALDEMGGAYLEIGQPAQALDHHAAAEQIHRELGDTRRQQQAAAHRDAARRALRRGERNGESP